MKTEILKQTEETVDGVCMLRVVANVRGCGEREFLVDKKLLQLTRKPTGLLIQEAEIAAGIIQRKK